MQESKRIPLPGTNNLPRPQIFNKRAESTSSTKKKIRSAHDGSSVTLFEKWWKDIDIDLLTKEFDAELEFIPLQNQSKDSKSRSTRKVRWADHGDHNPDGPAPTECTAPSTHSLTGSKLTSSRSGQLPPRLRAVSSSANPAALPPAQRSSTASPSCTRANGKQISSGNDPLPLSSPSRSASASASASQPRFPQPGSREHQAALKQAFASFIHEQRASAQLWRVRRQST